MTWVNTIFGSKKILPGKKLKMRGCKTNRIKPGKTAILTHDFSRGRVHLPLVCPTVLTVSKYDFVLKTDKSVGPNGMAVLWPTTEVMG